MTLPIASSILIFCFAMLGLAIWARSRVRDSEDFMVAGRRLSFPLATSTLLATWFGAGTLLVAADAIRTDGLQISIMEPFGAGAALFLGGFFFARRMWQLKLLTLTDLFRRKYGRKVELVSVVYEIAYPIWIATQFVALGGILNLFFGFDLTLSILLVAGFMMAYTLLGGMWSVAITDAAQLVLLAVGLVVLAWSVLSHLGAGSLGAGMQAVVAATPPEHLVWMPTERLAEFFTWLGLFIGAAIGNMSSQDFMQRMFASRSARTAVFACHTAGFLYVVLGLIPVLLGLAGNTLLSEDTTRAVLPALAAQFLSPAMSIVFVLTLMAAVMSSVDSGLLAPASVFAQNLLRPMLGDRVPLLSLARWCVVGVTVMSVAFALSGMSALELLQGSYAAGIPPLVVMSFAVYGRSTHPLPPLLTLSLGLTLWFGEILWTVISGDSSGGIEGLLSVPMPIALLILSAAVYTGSLGFVRWRGIDVLVDPEMSPATSDLGSG